MFVNTILAVAAISLADGAPLFTVRWYFGVNSFAKLFFIVVVTTSVRIASHERSDTGSSSLRCWCLIQLFCFVTWKQNSLKTQRWDHSRHTRRPIRTCLQCAVIVTATSNKHIHVVVGRLLLFPLAWIWRVRHFWDTCQETWLLHVKYEQVSQVILSLSRENK